MEEMTKEEIRAQNAFVSQFIELQEQADEESWESEKITISYYQAEQRYQDFLDELYGEKTICGFKFTSGRALRNLSPTDFRCGLVDWLDNEGIELE